MRLSDEDFAAGWDGLYVGPVPGVPATLAAAGQHLLLYAFTNSNPTHQRECPARYEGELAVFQDISVSSDLGMRKPDYAAFAAVADRTGFRPGEILFFDDTAENLTAARVAGLKAVLVRSSDEIRSALHGLGIATGVPMKQRP